MHLDRQTPLDSPWGWYVFSGALARSIKFWHTLKFLAHGFERSKFWTLVNICITYTNQKSCLGSDVSMASLGEELKTNMEDRLSLPFVLVKFSYLHSDKTDRIFLFLTYSDEQQDVKLDGQPQQRMGRVSWRSHEPKHGNTSGVVQCFQRNKPKLLPQHHQLLSQCDYAVVKNSWWIDFWTGVLEQIWHLSKQRWRMHISANDVRFEHYLSHLR